MSSDEKLLSILIEVQKNQKIDYSLFVNDKKYDLLDAQITKSHSPVKRPTYRGGVYFSDTYVYKIKGRVNDVSIIPILSKMMLGPNTEFGEILVTTKAMIDNQPAQIELYINLTNSMQSSSKVELNMTIVKANTKL